MKMCSTIVACVVSALLQMTHVAAMERVKVFVFAEANGPVPGRVAASVADSVNDLREAMKVKIWHRYTTKKREDATVFAQVTAREEHGGEYRVHAHVTTRGGAAADLTGTSTHQWKQAASDLGEQIVAWAKAQN